MCCSSAVISDNKWFESMWKQLVISVVGPRYEHLTHCSLLASGNSLEEQGVIAFHSLPALLRLERCFLDRWNCICGRGNLLSAAPSVLEGILSRASFLFRPPPVPHHIHPTLRFSITFSTQVFIRRLHIFSNFTFLAAKQYSWSVLCEETETIPKRDCFNYNRNIKVSPPIRLLPSSNLKPILYVLSEIEIKKFPLLCFHISRLITPLLWTEPSPGRAGSGSVKPLSWIIFWTPGFSGTQDFHVADILKIPQISHRRRGDFCVASRGSRNIAYGVAFQFPTADYPLLCVPPSGLHCSGSSLRQVWHSAMQLRWT